MVRPAGMQRGRKPAYALIRLHVLSPAPLEIFAVLLLCTAVTGNGCPALCRTPALDFLPRQPKQTALEITAESHLVATGHSFLLWSILNLYITTVGIRQAGRKKCDGNLHQ